MEVKLPAFADEGLHEWIEGQDDAGLDPLSFGVIGFDGEGVVRRYSTVESRQSGLSPSRVVGFSLFGVVAQCMNNFLVAQRFDDAAEQGLPLDDTIDYVLTLRMRPEKVRLRLLSSPALPHRYVLIERRR